jgi:two-component system, OmpR family, phosphate regulon sensor histidine kinase PhoR
MKQVKWFFHPILVFIFSVCALGVSLFLYIYWYIEVSSGLRSAIERFHLEPNQVLAADTWVVIVVLSILISIILLGIFIIFVFSQKTTQLYRMQNNFINNFTHELKTPVTSLQLYLQTFSKHRLSRDDQLKYIQYMLIDVNLLSENINRMLNLARLESKSYM